MPVHNNRKLVSSETAFPLAGENTFGLSIRKEIWQGPGTTKRTYWKYHLPDTVTVMPIMDGSGDIVAIEEFQPGPKTTYLHLPGETMEEGEDWLVAAERCLKEELGCLAHNYRLVSTILENSGRSDRRVYLVIAQGVFKIKGPEKDIILRPLSPQQFWNKMMEYFINAPDLAHGGGNTLKLTALAFHELKLPH